MNEELKPCPFCGSKDVFVMNPRLNNPSSILSNPRMEVICSNCGISMSPGFYGAQCDSLTDEQVDEIRHICVNAWNRRANAQIGKAKEAADEEAGNDRGASICHSHEWCPYKLLADLADVDGKYAGLSKAHKAYYRHMIEEGIKLRICLESQPKSLVEMVRRGELQPPQEINMCPCSDICTNKKEM